MTKTEGELAALLAELSRALEDVQTGRQLVAEGERKVETIRRQIGDKHPLIRALFSKERDPHQWQAGDQLPLRRRKMAGPIVRVNRMRWENQTIELLDGLRVAITAPEMARKLGITTQAAFHRLKTLAADGKIVRLAKAPGSGRDVFYQSVKHHHAQTKLAV